MFEALAIFAILGVAILIGAFAAKILTNFIND
jgi:hypothetical protein